MLAIFTDGSGSKDGLKGCAIYDYNNNFIKKFKINNSNSVFSTELFALWKAVDYSKSSNCNNVIIFSDSLSALKSLSFNGLNSKMSPLICNIRKDVSLCWELGIKLLFFWIPGHVNLNGNMIVDKAAKDACEIDNQFYDFCPYVDFLPILKTELLNNMQNYFVSYGGANKGRLYVLHSNKFNFSPWFALRRDLSRKQVCLVNRMRSGHSRARAHLASKSFLVEEDCECGGGSHSFDHLVWDCPSYSVQRHG